MKEPLDYLNRSELQLKIMQNLEREIQKLHHNNEIKRWWNYYPNWVRVQRFLNGNTQKAGSTSSTEQCIFIGIEPDGNTFFKE